MGIKQKHCLISGRVQGVSYRYSAQQQAHKLGVTGWVRNLADGPVELLIQGEAQQLEDMLNWANQGPRFAEVTTIEVTEQSANLTFTDFEIR
ncbi:MAG TPA: acylphosphatase [Methylophaga aminisulfidivorans]|uniref:acylphosphatase n=1 Tax=Methylophaga TaxID=40222 RepID=UPI00176E48DC|nr:MULTISPECIES: acylphosphatase [Methylophaga]HIC45613.1 acylphosphatase [Methylophaga sp.]HIM38600.1 acylphosphatase [Methylophaga aminisulfidivorans]